MYLGCFIICICTSSRHFYVHFKKQINDTLLWLLAKLISGTHLISRITAIRWYVYILQFHSEKKIIIHVIFCLINLRYSLHIYIYCVYMQADKVYIY